MKRFFKRLFGAARIRKKAKVLQKDLIAIQRGADGKVSSEEVHRLMKLFWPVIRETLNFLIVFTREKGDLVLEEIIDIGDELTETQENDKIGLFVDAYSEYHKPIKSLLEVVKWFSGPNVDRVVDHIMFFSDLLHSNELRESL